MSMGDIAHGQVESFHIPICSGKRSPMQTVKFNSITGLELNTEASFRLVNLAKKSLTLMIAEWDL